MKSVLAFPVSVDKIWKLTNTSPYVSQKLQGLNPLDLMEIGLTMSVMWSDSMVARELMTYNHIPGLVKTSSNESLSLLVFDIDLFLSTGLQRLGVWWKHAGEFSNLSLPVPDILFPRVTVCSFNFYDCCLLVMVYMALWYDVCIYSIWHYGIYGIMVY